MTEQPPPLPSPPGARLARIGLWLQLAPLVGIGETLRQVWPLIRRFYTEAATGGMPGPEMVTRWAEIVGDRHARVCMPEAIRFPPGEKTDGILDLVVVPAHAPFISHVTSEIIERVNRFFGYKAVARVKLRQGAVNPPAGVRPAAAPPSLRPVPVELGDSLRDIGDPELRKVLESLARNLGGEDGE